MYLALYRKPFEVGMKHLWAILSRPTSSGTISQALQNGNRTMTAAFLWLWNDGKGGLVLGVWGVTAVMYWLASR